MTTSLLSRFPLRPAARWALAVALLGAAPAGAVCVGDCNGDGRVSIAELQACVNLGSGLPAPACAAADQNNDGTVDPNDVDHCVQGFLDATGCPMVFTPAPTHTATRTPTVAVTNTPVPTVTRTNTVAPTNTPTPTITLTPSPTATAAVLGSNVCTLATGSQLNLQTAALALPLPPTGTFSITCGAQGADGTAPCECNLMQFGAVVIPGIGDVCVNPATGCEAGTMDCDGGAPLDVSLEANHNIGTCTTNAACQASCDTYCAGLPGAPSRQSYGCEGYCLGGSNDGAECGRDSECPGGSCTGGEPVAHFDTCNCICAATGGGTAAPAGSLSCNLGTQINVELPNSGVCGDRPATIQLAPVCGNVTTQTSVGVLKNANNASGATIPAAPNPVPAVIQGTGVSCESFKGGTITGLKLVGQLGFFDSTLGDIRAGNTFVCQ